jgi:hypothetical protein
MILDLQTMFSGAVSAAGVKTGQAFTDDAISTNVLDLRSAGEGAPTLVDEGILGEDVWLVVQALEAAAGGDAAKTLTITLESDSTADLATSATTLVRVKLPSGDYERYLGIRYAASAAFTAFGITAYLVVGGVQRNIAYPAGFTVG